MPIDNYLVEGATDYQQGGVFIYETPVYPVKTYVIPIQNIAGKDSKFLELVVKHAEAIDEYDVFKNEVVCLFVCLLQMEYLCTRILS